MYAGNVDQTTNGTHVLFTKAGRARPQVLLAKAEKKHALRDDHSNVNIDHNLKQNVNLTGRPTVMIIEGGKNIVGFIDTGSEVSRINSSSLNVKFASPALKARSLVGATGTLLDTIEERHGGQNISIIKSNSSACPLPGDILLGIDFLR